MFVDLHLCDWRGTPLYPVENGYYFLQKDKKQAKEYLRVTDEEMEILSKCDNKEYFKHQLFALGIVERWQAESKKAIQSLEELTGDVWVNPYKESEEMEGKYYTESAIQERKEAERIAKIEKRKNEVIKTFENRTMSITDFYNGRFVSGKILKRDYRIIWQRIVIATAALCGMFIFMMAIQLMCWLSNLCNYVFR